MLATYRIEGGIEGKSKGYKSISLVGVPGPSIVTNSGAWYANDSYSVRLED